MFNIEKGVGSTYSANKDKGITLGIGGEFIKSPFIFISSHEGKYVTVWVQPVVAFGFRYYTHANKLCELNLKFGHGFPYKPTTTNELDYKPKTLSPYSIRLSIIRFINY